MKALWLLLVIPLMGCHTESRVKQQLAYSGGDGSSCQQAVVIQGVTIRETGLLAQHVWLQQRYPGCRKNKDLLVNDSSRRFDQVELTTVDGKTSQVFFDVTDWWGN